MVPLLAERLDAVAVLHRVAAMIADADPHDDPVRVDHYRHGPYDMLLTLSGGRSIGLIRQGPAFPTSRLRYRLRSIKRLDSSERPFVTLVLTHADQATRRAIRSLGDPSEHGRTFVTTEGELLAGDHNGVVWQQCGSGLGEDKPVRIAADASLAGILALAERLLDSSHSFLGKNPKPNPTALYSSGVQASMPEPTQQLTSTLPVQLTRAEKDALDLLAAWPLCTREQLAGLMGGVTLRRVNQVLRSLSQHGLVRADGALHMLTDEGLTYLARRDRAAVGLTLDRWCAEPLYLNADIYAGTAVRTLASQLRHHAGVIDFAASLSNEVARSPDYDLFDLLPTSRSSIGYRYDWITYVILPDASCTLEYRGRWRPYLLEFERRATTPKRIPKRLESYRRYFLTGWAERDHGGFLPRVLFVFESSDNGSAFLDVADGVKGVPIITSNAETIAEQGILGDAWILPLPHSLDRRPLSSLDPGGRMTTTPFRPLPVRGVPAWLLGPFCRTSPPLLHLPPSRLRFGAELTRQGSPRPPHFSVALQLWLIATHASLRTLITSPMMATGACTTTGPSPFPRLPVGGQKSIPYTYRVSPQQAET